MGVYRARDFLRGPTLVSLTRIPLGALFVAFVERPLVALGIIVASGLTDVLDGWWARRSGQVTATGAVVDPVTDKIFVLCVVVALIATGKLPPLGVVALAAREIGELPLVLWFVTSRRARRSRIEQPMANVPGKLVTVLQFASVTAALFSAPFRDGLLAMTALAGAVAAVVYWRRALVAVG